MSVPQGFIDLVYREPPRPWVPTAASFTPAEFDVLKKLARKEIERSVEENERAELERLAKKYDATLEYPIPF